MNIGSINRSYSTQTTQSVSANDSVSGQGGSDADNPARPAATANVSKGAQMMQKLKELQQSDPSKFKQVVTDMAKSLRADAQKESGDGGDMMGKIADKLDAVAQSGDLSQLAPPPPPPGGSAGPSGAAAYKAHGHHGHHGGGGKAATEIEQALTAALQSAGDATAATSTSPVS